MKIAGAWINQPATQAVCAALTGAGHQALFVGGCVRNALIGTGVSDIDIATDALPERVTELAGAAGLRVVPTGLAHGTVTVIADGIPHEITTFRRDVETFGRHASVAFSGSVAEDAARRDFTMNALYARPDGAVIDPLHGLADLLARRVRFVGAPGARITEDYLRILRFFRFHAWYGDPAQGIDPEGLAACAAHLDGLVQLSRERVGAEMRKLLGAPDPAPAVAAMEAAGVLAAVLPGASARTLPVLVHLEQDNQTPALPPGWLRRLAALGGGDAAAGSLRLSRAEAAALTRLTDAVAAGWSVTETGYRLGAAEGADAVLLRAALLEQAPHPGWAADLVRGAAAVFPLVAADLMPALQGPALGERLRALERRWVASDFSLTRAELLA